MPHLHRLVAWAGRNAVPLVLVPLAGLLLWAAVWRIWLPPADGHGAVARTVTTVEANASTRPTHKVTTVVRTSGAGSPSRRSEALALLLVLLGTGAAVIGVFHDRIGTIELGKNGVKLELTPAERQGAAELVGRLAGGGAAPGAYARGIARYLRAVAARRTSAAVVAAPARRGGLSVEQATELAGRIVDEIT